MREDWRKGGKVDTCRRLDIQGQILRLHINYSNDVVIGKYSVSLSRRSASSLFVYFFFNSNSSKSHFILNELITRGKEG